MLGKSAFAAAMAAALGVASLAHAQVNWTADLQEARQALEEQHPDFFAHQDRAAFELVYDALARDIGALSEPDAVVRLAELVALGRDGHTRLTLPLAPQAGLFATHRATEPPQVALFGQYPVRLRRARDGYVVTRAAPEFAQLLGARLISVDGVPAASVEERLMGVVHGDNVHQQRDLAASFMAVPEVLAGRGIVRDAGESAWRFQSANGRERTVRLARRSSEESIAWRVLEGQALEEAPQSIRLAEGGVLVVRIAEVVERTPGQFAQFCEALERALGQQPPQAVLIDLRGNIGGDSSLIDPLVHLLVRERSLWAPARLFVAVDGGTFSAAIALAASLERWTPAIFIGSPTGAGPNHHGDARRIRLTSSGLTLRVSSLYWQLAEPSDSRDAMAPLIEAIPRVADMRSGVDPVLTIVQSATRESAAQVAGRWRGRIAIGQHLLGMQFAVSDTLTMEIPDAGFPTASLADLRTDGATLRASGEMAGFPVVVRARMTEAGMLGQLELRGRFYPFVAERT